MSPGSNTKSRLIKINNSGTVQWSKDYNLSFSYAFQPIFYNIIKNEIISISSLSPNSQDSSRFFINKTDTNGIVINTLAYKPDNIIGSYYIKTHDLIKLNNGNYASINSIGPYCCREPVILYLDSTLNILSAHKLQNSIGAIPQNFRIIKKDDDGFFITGSFFNANGLPFSFIINVTTDLNHIWAYY